MFTVGERVIHPGQGLCTVVGIEDAPPPMLVLEAGVGRTSTRLLYPLAQAELHLHPPVSRDEALDAIEHYASLKSDPHTDRNSGLEEAYFKTLLKRGVPDSLCVVKTMQARIAAAEQQARKPSSYLVRVLKEAQRRTLEELACALDTTPAAVSDMFREKQGDLALEA